MISGRFRIPAHHCSNGIWLLSAMSDRILDAKPGAWYIRPSLIWVNKSSTCHSSPFKAERRSSSESRTLPRLGCVPLTVEYRRLVAAAFSSPKSYSGLVKSGGGNSYDCETNLLADATSLLLRYRSRFLPFRTRQIVVAACTVCSSKKLVMIGV